MKNIYGLKEYEIVIIIFFGALQASSYDVLVLSASGQSVFNIVWIVILMCHMFSGNSQQN